MKTAVATGVLLVTVMSGGLAGQAPPQKFVPNPIRPSDLTVRVEPVGRMPARTNPTSPTVSGANLLLVDQSGYIYAWDGAGARELFTPQTAPQGLSLFGPEPLSNVAANAAGSKVYLVLISSRAPSGIPQRRSVRDPDGWYVVYEYEFDRSELARPRPVVAMQARSDGHLGGGLTVLEDGSLLFSVGDNGDSYEDGRDYSQSLDSHLSKIVRVDPADGSVRVVARGVRGAQRLTVSGRGDDARVSFIDDGGWVAEELNSILVKNLMVGDAANFGWGRNGQDGKAREGYLYIDRLGNSIEKIAAAESGFIEPVADFGRETSAAIAASGPVVSERSFSRITALFGDLVSGSIFAVTGALSVARQDVFRVQLVDAQGRSTTLRELAGNERPDPRFFNFPDGSAGVLLERTGQFYRLTEVAAK